MIYMNNPDLLQRFYKAGMYQDHLYCISVAGFKSEYILDRHQLSVPVLNVTTANRIVDFVAQLGEEDMCFISSQDFGLELAVVAAWTRPANLSSYVSPLLKNEFYYGYMRDAIQASGRQFKTAPEANIQNEVTTELFAAEPFESRTVTVERNLDPELTLAPPEIPEDLDARFDAIWKDFQIDGSLMDRVRIAPDLYYILFYKNHLYTKEMQQYLKERFCWIKEYLPDIWSYDSILVYLSDQPHPIPRRMSEWIVDHPGQHASYLDFM